MQERVQKILAKAGIASRRKAEELIVEGLVTINGKVAQLGDKAELGKDAIKVKGKLLQGAEAPVYLVFHKPKQVISMLVDPEGRPTLADYLSKIKTRIFPIGRLDFNSEGLILLTNDGAFAEKLQRRDDIPRVYHAKVRGHVTPETLERVSSGIKAGPRLVKPHSVRLVEVYQNKSLLEVVMMGSGAVDVKAMLETKGLLIERMIRVSLGHLTLRGLEPGHFRFLKPSQAEALLEQPELGMRRLEQEAAEARVPEVRKLHGRRGEREQEREGAPVIVRPLDKPAPPRSETPRFGGEKRGGDKRGSRPPRGEKRGGGFGEKRGFGAERGPRPERGSERERKPYGEKRGGGFGGGKPFGEKRGFGAERGPRPERGSDRERKPYGEKRGSFGGEKRGGFGSEKRAGAGGDRKPYGEKRGGGFGGAKRGGPRSGGGRSGIRVVRRPQGRD